MERFGGFCKDEFDDASIALARVESLEALRELVKSEPVFRSPYFHAYLRQQRFAFENDAQKFPEQFAAFLGAYDALFTMLHYFAFASEPAVDAVPISPATKLAPALLLKIQQLAKGMLHYFAFASEPAVDAVPISPATKLAPALLLEIQQLANGKMPALNGPPLDPSRDSAEIAAELEHMLGRRVALPDYHALPGALFALVRVRCARCGKGRLVLRAFAIDLRVNPHWLAHLQEGRVNADSCPNCGTTKAFVNKVWMTDRPAPADELAFLSCLCRRSDREAIYLPPPGTVRHPELDRILEIRLEMLARQLGGAWAHDVEVGVHTDGIAYSIDELSRRISKVEQASVAETEYNDVCQTVTEKLTSGELPYRDAENYLRIITGPTLASWPLIIAEGGSAIDVLVRRLIFEACLMARELGPAELAAAACSVSQAYAALGEIALAEMSLARTRDLLAEAEANDAAAVQPNVLAAQETLYIARGEHAEAAQVRARLLADLPEGSSGERLVRAELIMNQALAAQSAGQLAEALRSMQQGVETFAELERELGDSDPTAALRARKGRSGSLANLSGVRAEIASGLELISTVVNVRDFDALPNSARAALARIGSAEKFMLLQKELLETVPAAFPDEVLSPMAIRQRALHDLSDAIELAESVSDFEYLGIQWMQLSRLLDVLGRGAERREALISAARYAARAGDQARLAAVSWAQAKDAAKDGDVAARFDALERCLRAEMRRRIRGGHEFKSIAQIGGFALDAATGGEDGARAILIAEGTKKLALAQSIGRGSPHAASTCQPLAERLAVLLAEREMLRVQAMWQGDAEADHAATTAANDAAIVAARTELAQRDPHYAAWHDATFVELADLGSVRSLLGALGTRATLLGFLLVEEVGYCYALWQNGSLVRSRALGSALRKAARKGDETAAQVELTALAAALLRDMDEHLRTLEGDDRLILSPCAELEQVLFAALPSSRGILCQQTTLSTVHGIGMFEACAQRPTLTWQTAACLGAPSRPDLPRLDNARAEVTKVAELLSQAGIAVAEPQIGPSATVAALRQCAANSDLVHIACHAQPPSPQYPGGQLMLAPDLASPVNVGRKPSKAGMR